MKQQPTQQFITTPHAVFCLAFSPDGEQLAAGTGSYYAAGSQLLLYALRTSATEGDTEGTAIALAETQCVALTVQKPHLKNPQVLASPQGVSATALYFTPDNQQLWIATSASYRNQGPLFCFELNNEALQLPPPLYLPNVTERPILPGHYPDGFVHSGQQLFVCGHSMEGHCEGVIYCLDIASHSAPPSASSKMLQIDGQLITPGQLPLTVEQRRQQDNRRYKFGVSFTPLPLSNAKPEQVACDSTEALPLAVSVLNHASHIVGVEYAVLCMAQQPGTDTFITGNSAGQLHHWWFDGQWQYQQITPDTTPVPTTRLLIKDSIFADDCVVAIQYLPQHLGWLSLHANGLLIYWRGKQIVRYDQISLLGTPRCLALHPTKPLLAIGLKHVSDWKGAGIVLVDISAWLLAFK